MKTLLIRAFALVFLATAGVLHSQVPNLLNYQGRVAVGTPPVNFDGSGSFKFALVNTNGSTTYWSNDGSSTSGSEPTAAVTLTITKGLYSVQLGETSLTNMTALPASVFTNTDVRLRVWFNDGTHGFQLLSPDQRLAAAPFAVTAGTAAALTPQTSNLLVSVFNNFGPITTGLYASMLAPFNVIYAHGASSSAGAVGGSENTITLSGRNTITVPAKKIVGLSGIYSIGNANVFAGPGFQVPPNGTVTLIQRASNGTETAIDTITMTAQGSNLTVSHVLNATLDWSNNSYFIDVSLNSGNFSASGSQVNQGGFFTLQKVVLSYE